MHRWFAVFLLPLLLTPSFSQSREKGTVDFFASSDKRGVLLRWNLAGLDYPKNGVHVYRKAKGEKDFTKISKDPIQPLSESEGGKLMGPRYKKHSGKNFGAGSAAEKRQRDLMTAFLAEIDLDYARLFGLYAEDTTAQSGTRYVYELRADDQKLAGSKEVTAGQTVTVPEPTGVETQVVASGVRITWKPLDRAAQRVSGYHVYRNGSRVTPMAVPGPEYTDRKAEHDQTYTYTVVSVDAFGRHSGLSKGVEITHRDIVPPASPTGIHAAVETDTVKLSWRASDDKKTVGYNVYRVRLKGGKPEKINGRPVSETRFEDKAPADHYAYTVTSVDARGNESPATYEHDGKSRLRSAVLARVLSRDPPAPPKSISADLEGSKAALSWSASADAKAYVVYRSASEKGPFVKAATVKGTRFSEGVQTSFDEHFFYKVAAVDASGNESAPTSAGKVSVEGKVRPQARASSAGASKLALHLKNSKNVASVEVYRTQDDPHSPTAKWEKVSSMPPDSKEFEDKTARKRDAFSYAVATTDKSGKTSSKSVVSEPASSKVSGKSAEYDGFPIALSADAKDGAVDGMIKLPFFNVEIPVKVAIQGGSVTGVELASPVVAKLEPLGASVNITDVDFSKNTVLVDGEISIGLSGQFTLDKASFKDFGISTDGSIKSGTLGVKTIGVSYQGVEIALKNITIGLEKNKKYVAFTGVVKIADALDDAEASLRIEEGPKVKLEKIKLAFEQWDVKVAGEVEFDSANKAFKGQAKVDIETLGVGLDLEFQSGKKSDYSYFMINGTVTFPAPIPLGSTSLGINAFGGGFAYNMEASVGKGNKVSFAPKKGGFAFMGTIGVATMDGGQIFEGQLTLTISTGPVIELKGQGTIVKKIKVDSTMGYADGGFWLTATVEADLSPIVTGQGTIDLYFGSGKSNWHIYVGTEKSPVQGEIFGGKYGKGTFYIQITPGKFKTHVGFEFDTGKLEAWIFHATAEIAFDMSVEVDTTDWSFKASFSAKGDCDGGACVEALGKTHCVDFDLRVKASGTVERKAGKSVTVHGQFEVEVDVPVLGDESVSFSF